MTRKIIIFLVLSMIFISSCSLFKSSKIEAKEMSKDLCESAKGNWNECSSPCLGTGSDTCIQVCVAQCECGGIAGFECPDEYNCRLSGKIADEMGACVK